MKRRLVARLVLALLAVALARTPAFAWNSFGHMEVAAVAWEQLTPQTKARVGELLKLNPMYGSWIEGVAPPEQTRIAFLFASTWADVINVNGAYHTDGSSNGNRPPAGPEATQNIGYADHLRHKYWHFVDIPFSPDGTALEDPAAPNLQTQIAAFRASLSSAEATDDVKSYDLVWLIHLVGDAHQPLHATSRFTASLPHGDEGGNAVKIRCGSGCSESNLHAFWDNVLGPRSTSPDATAEAAKSLPAPPTELANMVDEKAWLQESVELAKSTVYAAPIGEGVGPYALTAEYKAKALDAAKLRAALAGYRLAALLNRAVR
jgi:hypothetical protein